MCDFVVVFKHTCSYKNFKLSLLKFMGRMQIKNPIAAIILALRNKVSTVILKVSQKYIYPGI